MSKAERRKTMFTLDKQIDGVTRKMNHVTYNAIGVVVTRLDELSPVGDEALWATPAPKGYRGGQFRGNWQLGVDVIPTGWLKGNIDPSGEATVAKNITAIPQAASRHKYYIVNNAPYALRIEQGWSTQSKPNHLTLRVKREFNGIVRSIVADIKAKGGRVR